MKTSSDRRSLAIYAYARHFDARGEILTPGCTRNSYTMMTIKRKFRSYRERHRVEIYLYNVVDKDVQSMLLPLNMMNIISFCPKYRINNNLITANNRFSKFMSLSVTTLFILIFVYNIYDRQTLYLSMNFNVLEIVVNIVNCSLFTFWFISNCTRSVFKTKDSILSVLKLQRIHRFINNEKKFKFFIISNWVTVILFLAVFVSSLIYITDLQVVSVFVVFGFLGFLIIDTHLICAIRLIQLLKDKVDLWNVQALQYQSMEDRVEEIHCERMFEAYVDVLDCYDIYKLSAQQLVSKI